MPKWTESKLVRIILDVILGIVGLAMVWLITILWNMTVAQQEANNTLERVQASVEHLETRTSNMELWKAETASNRFTVQDGIKLADKIAEIANILASLPKEIPPVWFKEHVSDLEQRHDREIAKLEERIRHMENGK